MALVTKSGGVWTAFSISMDAFNPQTDIIYTGGYTLIDDGDGDWRIKLLTSGTLTFSSHPNETVDIFLVGGGGGGGDGQGGGGGGGYTATHSDIAVTAQTNYSVFIGAGGAQRANGEDGLPGGTSSALGYSANGGLGGKGYANKAGGEGGSGGGAGATGAAGAGGSNGTNGISVGGVSGGVGQGTTTREFANASGDIYSGGGGGAYASSANGGVGGGGYGATVADHAGSPGTDNLGGGGGGSSSGRITGHGGSGIVIIRNHRAA